MDRLYSAPVIPLFAAFDPNEKRDNSGEWTSDGSGAKEPDYGNFSESTANLMLPILFNQSKDADEVKKSLNSIYHLTDEQAQNNIDRWEANGKKPAFDKPKAAPVKKPRKKKEPKAEPVLPTAPAAVADDENDLPHPKQPTRPVSKRDEIKGVPPNFKHWSGDKITSMDQLKWFEKPIWFEDDDFPRGKGILEPRTDFSSNFDDEKSAVDSVDTSKFDARDYQVMSNYMGSEYAGINADLRTDGAYLHDKWEKVTNTGQMAGRNWKYAAPIIKFTADNARETFAKHKLTKPVDVVRGVDNYQNVVIPKESMVGKKFTDNGCVSTSFDPSVGDHFMDQRDAWGDEVRVPVLFKIHCPVGTSGVPMGAMSPGMARADHYDDNLNTRKKFDSRQRKKKQEFYDFFHELVIAPGTSFTVSKDSNKTINGKKVRCLEMTAIPKSSQKDSSTRR